MRRPKKRILFTGYAHVHFLCFAPLYARLRRAQGVEVWLSGGLRTKNASGTWQYDTEAMYGPLGVPRERVLGVDALRERDFDVLFAGNTQLIEPRSVETRVQIFHGVSFRNKAVREENTHCDHYFVVGPYQRRKFAEADLFAEDDPRLLPIGFMKTDRLVDGSLHREDVLRRYGLSGRRPVVLYAPTGQRRNSMETMGEEVIARITASGRYDLLVKLHDHAKDKSIDWHARLSKHESGTTRVVREPDVVPLLHAADLLVTDASSVSTEYTLLDRPIVFLDVPELIARSSGEPGSMIDLTTWGRRGGVVVERADDVTTAIDESLAAPGARSAVRRAMARNVFYNAGRATDVAARWASERFGLELPSQRRAALSLTG